MRRREFLACVPAALTAAAQTQFQVACMTLPYTPFPFERALDGIRNAGYRHVAWGHTHRDANGTSRQLLAVEDAPGEAARLAARCRNMGLEPVMMFSNIHLEAADALQGHLRR